MFCFFFFFKQKTAYEMRISDWSSDVCSSDLMAMMEPVLAVLDETDSGLDIDALRVVAAGVNAQRTPERSMLLITHYQRLLEYIVPDRIHEIGRASCRERVCQYV